MSLSLSTPALLFPAISLLLLAYTNRFLALASRVRDLHHRFRETHNRILGEQIERLRKRLVLIKYMQMAGSVALLLCVLCMFTIYAGWELPSGVIFGLSMVFMMISLGLSIVEINRSVDALNLQLADMEEGPRE